MHAFIHSVILQASDNWSLVPGTGLAIVRFPLSLALLPGPSFKHLLNTNYVPSWEGDPETKVSW